jgi:hypothetical protein
MLTGDLEHPHNYKELYDKILQSQQHLVMAEGVGADPGVHAALILLLRQYIFTSDPSSVEVNNTKNFLVKEGSAFMTCSIQDLL